MWSESLDRDPENVTSVEIQSIIWTKICAGHVLLGGCVLFIIVHCLNWVTLHFLFFRIDIDVCFLSRSSSCSLHICAFGNFWGTGLQNGATSKALSLSPEVWVLLSICWTTCCYNAGKKDCVGSNQWSIVILRNSLLVGEFTEAVCWVVITCIRDTQVH